MKKTICALGTAALLFGLLTTAMAEKEALHFSEDSHSFIVTSEIIGRSEYGETAFDIRVTMDGNEIQTINFTAENVNEGQRETVLCDVNMDGYADLALMNSMGASDGFASYYLYEPMTGQFVHHPGLDRLSFYRAQFYPEKRYVLNYLHDSAATGIWELYQWQTDGELKLLSEAAIQFEGDALTAMAGRAKNGTIKISYTSEPFAYEDETRRRLEYDKLMAILFDGGDPGEAAELEAELKERVGIKKTIKDYGIDEKYFLDTLDEMTENAFDDQCTGANPRYPLMSEIKQMYLNAYYGKKHFEEKPMPTEADIAEDDSAHNFKQAYRRAENGKNKA